MDKPEFNPLVLRLQGLGIEKVGEFIDFMKDKRNFELLELKEMEFLGKLLDHCNKLSEKYTEKYENSFSILKKKSIPLLFSIFQPEY